MAAVPSIGTQPPTSRTGRWPVAGGASTLRLFVDPCPEGRSHAIGEVRTAFMESESGVRGLRLGVLPGQPVVRGRVVRLCIAGVGAAVCDSEARAGRCNGRRATTGQDRARVSTVDAEICRRCDLRMVSGAVAERASARRLPRSSGRQRDGADFRGALRPCRDNHFGIVGSTSGGVRALGRTIRGRSDDLRSTETLLSQSGGTMSPDVASASATLVPRHTALSRSGFPSSRARD